MSTAIVWFRRDLRLQGNPALDAALSHYERVIPLYIHAPEEEGQWPAGAASRWWLHQSLAALHGELRNGGAPLHIRRGNSREVLDTLLHETGAEAVYWNRCYEPAAIARDTEVKAHLRNTGVQADSFAGSLWAEPWHVANKQGGTYRVFTPFWRELRTRIAPSVDDGALTVRAAHAEGGLSLDALGLMPALPWFTGMQETWCPGERGAHEALELFADDALAGYAGLRDVPARHGTSRLSAHLHFGEITPAQVHAYLDERVRRVDAKKRPDLEPYLRELGWREFAHHLLFHFPRTTEEPFQPSFAGFPWAADDANALERWQQGRTGIPLVDAGMRELWHTGWMHNRVRMIVASFLTKNLRQHWLHGARWFWDTLVDADLANNTLGWQWVAGCGADAAPYFRVFNPVTQAQKFDPQAEYLRRWLPELAHAPTPLVHEPWKDPGLLRQSGYPAPMLDLAASRETALAAYQAMRGQR